MENIELQLFIENKWNGSAQSYSIGICNELSSPLRTVWLEKISAHAPEKKTLDILDIGTGPGFFAVILGQAGHNITAIDCSADMLAEAAKNTDAAGVKAAFHKMDSHQLAFPDNTFDLIICRNVTWTLYNPVKAYTEWERVLRPGGRMMIFDSNWGLQEYDEELRLRNEKNAEKYRRMFHKEPHPTKSYYDKMFMSDKRRPDWDLAALREIGLNPYCEKGVSEQLWSFEDQVQFEATPMFMIVAEKLKSDPAVYGEPVQ
jgi:ubiquinone/menaquinone biosynthesis C-methylase UbiE